MISGVDYVLFSDVPFSEIRNGFEKKIKQLWPQFLINKDPDNEEVDFLYAKDQALLDHYDENGYSLNEQGDSCFLLMASQQDSPDYKIIVEQQISPIHEFGDPEPYESRIIGKSIWMYTLVLPAVIEDSSFSQKIYEYLIDSMRLS